MRAILLLAAALPLAAQPFDSGGRLRRLLYDGEELPVRTTLAASLRGGAKIAFPAPEAIARVAPDRWSGVFEPEPGMRARCEETAAEKASLAEIVLRVSPEAEFHADALYYVVRVPWDAFAGGRALGAALPAVKPAEPEVARVKTRQVTIEGGGARKLALTIALDRERTVAIRDEWDEEGHFYSAWIEIADGSLDLTLSLAGQADHSPALLTVDPAERRYKLDGFGGNYCFQIESPATDYTLKNLKVRWARTEMSLVDWAPENDKPDSRLRHEFELARRIQQLGIPYVSSVWRVPGSMVVNPADPPWQQRHRIALTSWDDLARSIVSYLLYAKRTYGVEPTLFSFNEANIGVYVGQTPKTHAETIKRIGAHFRKLGLKTRMLLGDATGPRDTHKFALEAAADPEVLQYVGAVAFHSWGGGTPEQYAAWGDLAEWLQLPLLVSELGVDAAAYNGRAYNSYHYGLREVRMTQELLLHARPQGTQFWQFTNDYGLARAGSDGAVEPTARLWLMKHFTDLTPQKSEAITTSSDQQDVLFTAFRAGEAYGLHILNLGPAREIAIEGLPDADWNTTESTEAEQYREKPAARPTVGTLRLKLPGRSLTTLTARVPARVAMWDTQAR